MSIYDRGVLFRKKSQDKLSRMKEREFYDEIKSCSFHPTFFSRKSVNQSRMGWVSDNFFILIVVNIFEFQEFWYHVISARMQFTSKLIFIYLKIKCQQIYESWVQFRNYMSTLFIVLNICGKSKTLIRQKDPFTDLFAWNNHKSSMAY
jgi:hypothetical protein